MRTSTKLAAAFLLMNLAAAIYASRSGRAKGRMLGIPYDFTKPGPDRIRDRLWSRESSIVTQPVFGAGWSLNLQEIGRRLGFGREDEWDSSEIPVPPEEEESG